MILSLYNPEMEIMFALSRHFLQAISVIVCASIELVYVLSLHFSITLESSSYVISTTLL